MGGNNNGCQGFSMIGRDARLGMNLVAGAGCEHRSIVVTAVLFRKSWYITCKQLVAQNNV